ncbi:uncharacterized protein LOC118403616 [Branchiostoma floridae]|uniref:Uncharacterized protein LOC118403616 n=1 Tax=Branchiostoma floridae TaxID=7739 RepID=C3YKC7_BRAFL|nr:uncharacterized protein LOC118403616 [Branchiostoma floridae]|eukprot:XP_002603277.1 hypothetical protein BRAFLDRAFT_93341 [Branchiostoma floridae]
MKKDKKKTPNTPGSGPSEEAKKDFLDHLEFTSQHMLYKSGTLYFVYILIFIQAQCNPTPENCALMWTMCEVGLIHGIVATLHEAFALWYKDQQDIGKKKEKE